MNEDFLQAILLKEILTNLQSHVSNQNLKKYK
jgi:hypothetical protein